MNVVTKSVSELFMDELLKSIGAGQVYDRVVRDMEQYDKPVFDKIDHACVVALSGYGSTTLISASRFIDDLYLAKTWNPGGTDYTFYIYLVTPRIWKCVPLMAVHAYLYEAAKVQKSITNRVIMPFNNIEGYIITWEKFLGTIPEEWRAQLEEQVFDEAKGCYVQPLKVKLKELYDYEVGNLIGYMRLHNKRVEVKEEGTDKSEWIDVKVTKIGVSFEGFCPIQEGSTQTTAFFQASDMTPDFDPEPRFNWHCQNSSRWLYSGAIALNFYKDVLTVSSHH